ncbi:MULTISPECIES: DnaA ATPase domain-containing protein [Halocynthiibacter]|uniref:DnaA/Hda family protein n=1 Tax=Halocynthiibacter halioticoli TaxID=2986804 RepID=A0AAE3IZJ5_9RHOB|nr:MULTISPECIES: DnaA/Hda family protein [Halocynthiibacter]MCV6823793.1 DnaA/Hda family protein [Halocynthiibacter halioticoli]MCW4056794.1 DnaA/Hda family protein [Halocynthiibacter sp. SDUM655004]
MPQQLAFELPVRAALGRDDFLVAPSNSVAVATLADWAAWPLGKMVLVGDEGAGKTHLCHVWAEDCGATVLAPDALPTADIDALATGPVAIDGADMLPPEAQEPLFHLHNQLAANGQPLLLTGQTAPSRWPLTLPDLRSRLEATAVTRIEAPDDALLAGVLVKHFNDRQISIAPEVVNYVIKRAPRSLGVMGQVSRALDQTALAEGRAVTRVLAAKVLDALDNSPS